MQRAHIDLCCIVINSGHLNIHDRPCSKVMSLGVDKGKTCHWALTWASWWTVNPVAGPLYSYTSLPFLLHFKSTARQKVSFQYVDLREVTHAQCRKNKHLWGQSKIWEYFIYERPSHEVDDKEREKITGITCGQNTSNTFFDALTFKQSKGLPRIINGSLFCLSLTLTRIF